MQNLLHFEGMKDRNFKKEEEECKKFTFMMMAKPGSESQADSKQKLTNEPLV